MEQKFHSNINCSACVLKVKSILDEFIGVEKWHVDTQSRFKVLTIDCETPYTSDQINLWLEPLGYRVRPLEQ
jgi:copper chaperone